MNPFQVNQIDDTTWQIEYTAECPTCHGAGVDRNSMFVTSGCAVVCQNCKGTGCVHKTEKIKTFSGRKVVDDVKRVFETTAGRVASLTNYDMGGITYEEWLQTQTFPRGSEPRVYLCPAQWAQGSGHWNKKPEWAECQTSDCFVYCQNYSSKNLCWVRYDEEQERKGK